MVLDSDWVKMDWCNSKGEVPKDTYPTMSKAMNASGRHMHFNMCEVRASDAYMHILMNIDT